MNDIILKKDEILEKLVYELCKLSIEELIEFKTEWKEALTCEQKIINVCMGIVDLVIKAKRGA